MTDILKTLAGIVGRILVAPLAYPIAWLSRFDRRHLIFQFGSHVVAMLPGLPGVYLRREFYKVTLGLKSTGFVIEFGTIFAQRGTEIGDHVYIGPFSNIGLSVIEDDVLLGSNVDIVSGRATHAFAEIDMRISEQEGVLKKIRIGRGSWIGNKAVVLESVGAESVVGAGSVVTRELGDRLVAAGNPAREIRTRSKP
jgi:virginiamycin A acetyltransferase